MTECIIPLSGNETIRDTLTYEYKYTYYDYISINTMKMFVVRRYWNMVSLYIYIYLLSCTYVYMHITVCIYALCVCVVMHYTVAYLNDFVCTLQRRLVHRGLEAKCLFALVSQWPSHR